MTDPTDALTSLEQRLRELRQQCFGAILDLAQAKPAVRKLLEKLEAETGRAADFITGVVALLREPSDEAVEAALTEYVGPPPFEDYFGPGLATERHKLVMQDALKAALKVELARLVDKEKNDAGR